MAYPSVIASRIQRSRSCAGTLPLPPPLVTNGCKVLTMTFDVAQGTAELITDRRSRDRRNGPKSQIAGALAAAEARPAVSERRKVERRRQIDPTTCERDYSEDEIEFMSAMDHYKRKSGRMFPTWSEVLEVLVAIGYRKVAEPTEVKMK